MYIPGVYAYIILKEGVKEAEDDIIKELKDRVRQAIAAYAVPDKIQVRWIQNNCLGSLCNN